MCRCAGRNPEEGGCPQGNADPNTCLGGEHACEHLAEREAKRLAAEREAEPPFELASDQQGLTPEEELALDIYKDEGANHD